MAEKKCKYCAMMIPKEASICPHCRKRQGTSAGVKALAVLLILFLFAFIGSLSKTGSNFSSSLDDRAFTAWAVHNLFVKNALKAPATAEFAPQSASKVETVGKDIYKITSYVDAQNSFGAKIRNYYTIVLKDNGPDKWQVVSLKFNK
jgi:hypothetical protein